MSLSKTASRRIITTCALIICAAGIAGGAISIMPMLGLRSPGSNVSWVRYFAANQSIWRVPVEFYMAMAAGILLTVRRSIHWSMLLCTVLFAISLWVIRHNSRDVLLWIIILLSVVGLYALNAAFAGTLKTFGREFIDDIMYIRQRSASVWKLAVVLLAGVFVINYLHGEIIRHASEDAKDERLLKQYRDARAESVEPGVIRLEIFTDYQCPACSQLTPKYLETAEAVGGAAILVELRDYPLDSACNNNLSREKPSMHPAACVAAYAVRLAEREMPDKAADLRAWLYANRTELDNDVIQQKLIEAGVNNPHDMFDSAITQAVRADIQAAKSYGIGAVPFVVLNGVLLPPGLNPSKLEMLLEYEMGR
jgi:predicted DsbA family dithiol-disulfide isomerase